MSFLTLELAEDFVTGYQDPNKELFEPLLTYAETFDIAVGYFTSGWLKDVMAGIKSLALRGGKCRIVVSPHLNEEDAKILTSDSEQFEFSRHESLLLAEILDLEEDTRELLATLIKYRILEFKIASPKTSTPNLFHAKIAVAEDAEGNRVAINGSFNFTSSAKGNWEYISLYRSYEQGELSRIQSIQSRFQRLWSNEDSFYEVNKPSDALVNIIDSYSRENMVFEKKSSIPKQLRPYQEEAISAWFENKGHGMYIMATGSGKTITALSTVKRLLEAFERKGAPLFIVFVLPLKHLLDQWYEEAKEFGFDVIKCYEDSTLWRRELNQSLNNLSLKQEGTVMAMVTNATLALEHFPKVLRKAANLPMMIVADEAHNLGSVNNLANLPREATFRLGLTATPERFNDPTGTEALKDYFGGEVFEFTLEDAINQGFLVKYNYYPILCEFDSEEFQEYKRIIKALNQKELSLVGAEDELEQISGSSTNKFLLLRKHLESLQQSGNLKHTLVYCGHYKDEEGSRQIEKVTRLLGHELKVKVRKFTADESLADRKDILDSFASGELQAIAAIKCLDEGVDVPATKDAFVLASTANPREFIQRRGRVLRHSTGKSVANIYDFIMVPPDGEVNAHLVEREVKRGLEYNSLALNRLDNISMFDELIDMHSLETQEQFGNPRA
jgi:superfamily II DNA or RNA helicase